MVKRFILTVVAISIILLSCTNVLAADGERVGIRPTPPLHVEGNQLKDPAGNNVFLHGWMQPTSSYFNGQGKWYIDPWDWTKLKSPLTRSGVSDFLNYLEEVATLMTDPSPRYGRDHGWYCSFVRLNTDAVGGWSSAEGLVDLKQFDAWIENFLVPYANILRSRGLYLVLCATGPMVVNVDGDMSKNDSKGTQERLMLFWERVASHPGIKNADNVMFELMNEPVMVETVLGNNQWGMQRSEYFSAFTEWLQPIIDVIRSTGANNVIWVPTLEWQGSPQQWAMFPFNGENIGVAVHYYPAYGGVFDNSWSVQNLWDRQYKPAADRWPMIITEMFWTPFPDDPWNLVNGKTEGFGKSIKKAIDQQGNVSYLVGFIGDLLDDLNVNRPYACELSEREGAQAYFDWMPELAQLSYRSYGYQVIPGQIKAEEFEAMSSGIKVSSHPINFGQRYLSNIQPGAWLNYLIDVAEAGTYQMQVKYKMNTAANVTLSVHTASGEAIGVLQLHPEEKPQLLDWQSETILLNLPAGQQELHFVFDSISENFTLDLDWFEFTWLNN